jgi:hypothetical protein
MATKKKATKKSKTKRKPAKSWLLKAAEGILKDVERACDNDEEVNYGGRGSNPGEVLGLARHFVEMVREHEARE